MIGGHYTCFINNLPCMMLWKHAKQAKHLTAETLTACLDSLSKNNYTFPPQTICFWCPRIACFGRMVSWMRDAESWARPCCKSAISSEVCDYQIYCCVSHCGCAASQGIRLIKPVKMSPIMFNEHTEEKSHLTSFKISSHLPTPSRSPFLFVSVIEVSSPLGL